MTRLRFKLLPAIIVALLLLLVTHAWATWTVTETRESVIKSDVGSMVVIKLNMEGDGSSTDYALTKFPGFRGDVSDVWYLYGVKKVPASGASVPTATFDIDVEDDLNFHLLDINSATTSTTQWFKGHDTLGVFPPVNHPPSVVVGDIGSGATIDLYLYFVR